MKNERQDFSNPLKAVNWLAVQCTNQTQFEALRGEMMFNHLFTGRYFVYLRESDLDVVFLDNQN